MSTLMPDQDWAHNPSLALPAYTYVDAARYAGVPAQTVRNWFRGVSYEGHHQDPIFDAVPQRGLSYLQLVEVAFIAEARRKGIKLRALRTAYRTVQQRSGSPHPFVEERFMTNGAELFLATLEDPTVLISASQPGQRAWRTAVETYEDQFDYTNHLALRWYPRGHRFRIVIDPFVAFGRPTIAGKGIPTDAIADRIAAGDDPDSLEDDFGLTHDEVRDALWFEESIHHAA